ncbi:MAG: protein kinase [Myxococcaceae bacterium]|nr:protein kinase [Myxococcaceae bacterium]
MNASYRLTGRLEAGDLAELYKASQEPGGAVVVKLFHPKTSDPAYARALAETSRVLSRLKHAGIVRYVDIGFVKERLAVVREHVDGYTLGTALQRLQSKEAILPAAIALYFIIQLLELVQKAHEAGVIHGAITPGNVMLSREATPGICDFGALSALMEVPELKRGFAPRGRSAYRAPEVSRGEEPTTLCDIYSLGAIAYELLTLREAVVTGGGISTRSGGLPAPSRLDRRINSRLDPIILRALEPLPGRRFRSAGEFAMGLRNFLSTHGGLPGQEELRRFVRELVPNEVNLSTLGPVPFAEPFQLTPVSGAEIAHLRAEPLEASVVTRPSFSRSLSQEEALAVTDELAPRFQEHTARDSGARESTQLFGHKPVPWGEESTQVAPPQAAPWGEQESTQPTAPNAEPPREEPALEATRIRPPRAEPALEPTHISAPSSPWGEGEDTQRNAPALEPANVGQKAPVAERADAAPVQVAPPGKGWEAPPGAVPARPRKAQLPMAGLPGAKEGTRVGRHPRMKWVEDFAQEKTHHAEVPQEEPRSSAPKERPEIPAPPTDESNPVVSGDQRLLTEEVLLLARERRQRQALSIVGAIAVVGLLAFLLAVQFGPPSLLGSSPDADPSALRAVEAPGAREGEARPAAPQDRGEPQADANSAFLSIRTNLPARVYVDGALVGRRTPLMKFPVKPGNRLITLEALATKERAEFPMRFEKGQHRPIEHRFESIPRR